MDSPEKIWKSILDQVSLQIPQTTFDAWLRETRPHSISQDEWKISAISSQACEWLSHHLYPLIKRSFDQTLSFNNLSPATLTFIVPTESKKKTKYTQNQILYQFVDFDLFERGWLKVPHYYDLFWQPLIGYPAYAFWRYQQLVNWTRYGDHTRNRVIDLSRAAAHLGIDRKILKGPKGGQIGGALLNLQKHGLGDFDVHGKGRHTTYSGRVLRVLPLISPHQAEFLPSSIQEDHVRWLIDAGYDIDEWYNIPSYTLAGSPSPFGEPDWEALEPLGYLVTPAYYDLFLQPLIKSVGYGIWRLLKCLYYAPNQRYTRERQISIEEIATRLDCHRQAITGCSRRRDGIRYWQDGALDIMQQEGIASLREEGRGRQRSYRIRVLNSPPILTPSQVQRMPLLLSNAHDEWIERAKLDLAAWQQLELPLLTGVQDQECNDVQ